MAKVISFKDIGCEINEGRFTGDVTFHCYCMGKDNKWYSQYYSYTSKHAAMEAFYHYVNFN